MYCSSFLKILILSFLSSGLNKLFIDVENQLALGTMARFINNEDNLAVLTKMDQEIAQFLELYSVSLDDK